MAQWLDAVVESRNDWNDHLFSLQFECPAFEGFTAGQFVKLGIEQPDGKILSRPYSLVNSPDSDLLEIIAVPVEEGVLSPRLHALNAGDAMKVMAPATGFLTLDEVPDADSLWLLATGTGVGPFLSILGTDEVWERFKKINLVYAARYAHDLAYQNLIEQWSLSRKDKFSYVPVISRESVKGVLQGRIPMLLQQEKIQRACADVLHPDKSHVMMCGNPEMIQSTIDVLAEFGLKKHMRRAPGHITMERYW